MHKAQIFSLACAMALLSSCAQMAPPVPPSLELPKVVGDLKAIRKGDKVYLRWTQPAQTTDGESADHLGPTLICRSLDGNAAQCEKMGQVLPTQSPKISTNAAAAREANYTDTLSTDVQQDSRKIFSYSVSVENESGR